MKDDIAQLVESQQEIESSFEEVVSQTNLGAGDASHHTDVQKKSLGAGDASHHTDVQNAAANVRNNAAVFALSLKQHPLATDNLDKVQADRF